MATKAELEEDLAKAERKIARLEKKAEAAEPAPEPSLEDRMAALSSEMEAKGHKDHDVRWVHAAVQIKNLLPQPESEKVEWN